MDSQAQPTGVEWATADRHIRLERASNVRDMGGYATRCGRAVRRGRVYRAGELVRLTDRDVATLDGLGLQLIYDLRTSDERARRPSRLWGETPRRLHRDYDHSGADLPSLLAQTGVSADRLRESMITLYRALPLDQADAFRALFREIAAGALPLLFHCAGGKDRTGAFAALLHDALGVSRDDAIADYLLSNDGLAAARLRFLDHVGRADADPAAWDPMLIVDPAYLDAMFAAVAARHGDTAGYFAWLGLTPDDLRAIRTHLLEPE